MTKKASLQDYWNSRAEYFGNYDAPLIPNSDEYDFMRRQLVPGGHTLILGITPEYCKMALEVSDNVTAVDFAKDMIDTWHNEKVEYICMEWIKFLGENPDRFDNIMLDGGLCCLEFPKSWQQISDNISRSLRPKGIFASRVFINTEKPPENKSNNPNLTRFLSGMGRVDSNWMMKVETHDDYKEYDVHYAFPPEEVVLKTFDQLTLCDKLVPDYDEAEHFVSYAWRRPR